MNRATLSVGLLLLFGCSAATPPAHERTASAIQSAPSGPIAAQPAVSQPATTLGLRPQYQHCVDAAAGVVPDTQACIGTEFTYQDQRLKAALARRLGQPDSTGTAAAQAAWRKATDARCAWNAAEEGQGQRLEANACELEAIAVRADELSR